jgi:hypothetical protein
MGASEESGGLPMEVDAWEKGSVACASVPFRLSGVVYGRLLSSHRLDAERVGVSCTAA